MRKHRNIVYVLEGLLFGVVSCVMIIGSIIGGVLIWPWLRPVPYSSKRHEWFAWTPVWVEDETGPFNIAWLVTLERQVTFGVYCTSEKYWRKSNRQTNTNSETVSNP